jgi:hypothetical protein
MIAKPEKMNEALARKYRKLREKLLRPVLQFLDRNPRIRQGIEFGVTQIILTYATAEASKAVIEGRTQIELKLATQTIAKELYREFDKNLRTALSLDMTQLTVEYMLASAGYEVRDRTLFYSQGFSLSEPNKATPPPPSPVEAEPAPTLEQPGPPMLSDSAEGAQVDNVDSSYEEDSDGDQEDQEDDDQDSEDSGGQEES